MTRFQFSKKTETPRLPETAGVYCFSDGKEILYIGKAANIKVRVKNHLSQPTYRDNLFLNRILKIGFIKTDSEVIALLLEANLIKKYQPKYNVAWRDDKNYFYICLTKEEFPRIFITHQPNPKSDCAGPFVDGRALKQTLKILRKVFPFRSCKNLPKKPCLWYQLNRCPAPCLLKTNLARQLPDFKDNLKKESKKNARNLLKILEGRRIQVQRTLKKEMKILSKREDFEGAGKIRDQIFSLEKTLSNARIFDNLPFSENWQKTSEILQKLLNVKKEISRIEAYDVSNIQGQFASGSLATFINGRPDRNFYRRFKIKISGKPDDTAMLKEVLRRRFSHREWDFPDLVLIDGGRGQLNAGLKIKEEKLKDKKGVKFLSLAKKENKLFIEGRKEPILLKELPRQIFNLMLQLRDEAHRFAIFYHRKLRYKNLIKK